ncbi:hypothetical protein CAOG_00789 [Capsaspora owczarzaki ATCC 30864]|uniref:F-box domain-containing protein n=1 Tax=Capsaspora owczarzaki (strain ATCC 30864) TaxID=595528 RepID=A0A0D2WJ60_CAPO3|nr:hypothetical protein CAOG_00789 [Capsaspora owczarzaki ATCC 30864]KJE89288.1 hypothetical protein CAOG_000789 [Capsaspora owczarzaki ATCC 30864]|eukprot:XP_004365660.2 hypothetical protein CAOG_00789 [Capsaspora owczarzaki ATCC 30864]
MELLPAEIVMEIFERLPFRDVLSASRVCRFWFEVAIDYLSASIDLTHEHRGIDDKTLRFILTRLQPRQLNLTNCDEITQTGRGYLMDHGQSLETLTAPSLLVSAHNMMTRMDNLTNLEELVIKAIHLTPEFRLPPNLKKLWVESQFVVSNDWSWEDTPYLTDVRVASMQLDERPEQLNRLISSVRLSALRMHHCSVYVTQPLAGLENLHTLELHNPVRYNFTQKYTYIPLFASCPNLVNLVIREADGLTDKMVDDWLALLPNLQSLSLNQGRASRLSDATLTAIATRCPKLRELKLESFLQMTDVGLTTLASSCPKLETVWIPFCRNIGDAGLQSLFTWCKDLRDLDISGCTHVTEDMIGSMIKNGISLDRLAMYGIRTITGNDQAMTRLSDLGVKVLYRPSPALFDRKRLARPLLSFPCDEERHSCNRIRCPHGCDEIVRECMAQDHAEVCLKHRTCPRQHSGCRFTGTPEEIAMHMSVNPGTFKAFEAERKKEARTLSKVPACRYGLTICRFCDDVVSLLERRQHMDEHDKQSSDIPAAKCPLAYLGCTFHTSKRSPAVSAHLQECEHNETFCGFCGTSVHVSSYHKHVLACVDAQNREYRLMLPVDQLSLDARSEKRPSKPSWMVDQSSHPRDPHHPGYWDRW